MMIFSKRCLIKNMKIKLLTNFSFLAVLLANIFVAPHVLAIDLKQSLEATYNNNESFKSSQVDFLNSVESFSKAVAKFLPNIYASIQRSDDKTKTFDSSTVQKSSVFSRSIVIEQNLFNSGGDMATLKAAQSAFKSAKYVFYENEQSSMVEAISVYLKYLQARKICDINEKNVNYSQKRFDSIEAKLKLGEASKNELALAEANLFAAQSQRAQSLSDLEQAKGDFKQTIGVNPEDVQDVELPTISEDFKEFFEKVKANNFTIHAAKHALAASKSSVIAQAANLLPTVTARASWGSNYYDPQLSIQGPRPNTDFFSTSVAVNLPIFSSGGAVYSEVRVARNGSRKRVLDLEKAIKKTEANVYSIWESYKALKTSLEAANSGVQSQILAVAGTTQEFELGLKTIVDVLKVESDLVNQQIQQVQVYTNCILAAYKLKFLSGDVTAQKLNLKVKFFNPEAEFRKIKMKVVGF